MRSHLVPLSVLLLVLFQDARSSAEPPPALGPKDALRHEFAPYDLAELNWLGMNYCENLLDCRVNITSYTHLGYDANNQDAWHLQFPDDAARLLEGVAWEAEYSPIVRLELARRLVKGLLRGHIPGSKDYYSFRHRSGGKTFLILSGKDSGGRVTLSNWGDSLEGAVKVGFRLSHDGAWHSPDAFSFTDTPEGAGDPGTARSPRYWHESPFVFQRSYTRAGDSLQVAFEGRYWLSDEDKPLEFNFSSGSGDSLQVVLGEPGKPIPLLGAQASPTFVHLPGQNVVRVDPGGSRIFQSPDFSYFILRRATAWACPGYSAALLVILDQQPSSIEILPSHGAGEVCLTYPAQANAAQARLWLYPFSWVNDVDMRHIHRSARSFLAEGTLKQHGYPSQQLVNAVPAGLAAGAYLLAKYKDPFAMTAAIRAEGAADAVLAPLADGKSFIRSFFPVRAAAWMVRLGKERKDSHMVEKYTAHLDRWMKLMTGPALGYDGTGWGNGWDHFNCVKAAALAWSATGNPDYRQIYERALSVYTIDEKGIYRQGKPLKAPGGFETYAGSLPLGAWGHAGRLKHVEQLINLNVPNGWHAPETPVKDLWNDAGAGPWAQDDSNPEYVGFSLRGLNLPLSPKWVVPIGAFPSYDSNGTVNLRGRPLVENPWFRPGRGPLLQLPRDSSRLNSTISSLKITPGTRSERRHLQHSSGTLKDDTWACAGGQQLLYKFDVRRATGAAVDCELQGGGYQLEVSPDGKRWVDCYDSWSDTFTLKSWDLSFLTGAPDEFVKLLTMLPPADTAFLSNSSASTMEREHSRYLSAGSYIVYRLDLGRAGECLLEVLAGNGYRLEGSPDGKTWQPLLDARTIDQKRTPDAAWLSAADASGCLSERGTLYLRFSDTNRALDYGGRSAFLRRLTVYGNLKAEALWLRISNSEPNSNLLLKQVVFRTWK